MGCMKNGPPGPSSGEGVRSTLGLEPWLCRLWRLWRLESRMLWLPWLCMESLDCVWDILDTGRGQQGPSFTKVVSPSSSAARSSPTLMEKFSRALTLSLIPFSQAMCRGVFPAESCALTSKPETKPELISAVAQLKFNCKPHWSFDSYMQTKRIQKNKSNFGLS